MRTITETQTVYQFAELSESAKESARDWYRQGIELVDLSDSGDWQEIAAILGIEFATDRPGQPKIYWSGFYNQGDGASWHGSYSYARFASRRIRQYAPLDTELHRIADSLQALQRRYFYRLSATVTSGPGSNYCNHSSTMAVDVEGTDSPDAQDSLQTLLRDFADWIYSQLEAQYEWLNADAQVDESIEANEYEFTESGEIV